MANFLLIIFTFQEFLHSPALYNFAGIAWFITSTEVRESQRETVKERAIGAERESERERALVARECQSGTARELPLAQRMRCAVAYIMCLMLVYMLVNT